jgi:hypothetical protein
MVDTREQLLSQQFFFRRHRGLEHVTGCGQWCRSYQLIRVVKLRSLLSMVA